MPTLSDMLPSAASAATIIMQHINKHRRDPKVIEKEIAEGRVYLQFMISLYAIQMEEGRYFLHEHPSTASSWSEREMLLLAASPSVKLA